MCARSRRPCCGRGARCCGVRRGRCDERWVGSDERWGACASPRLFFVLRLRSSGFVSSATALPRLRPCSISARASTGGKVRGGLGSRGPVGSGRQGFSLRVERSTRREKRCPSGGFLAPTMLLLRGTVHGKGEARADRARTENRGAPARRMRLSRAEARTMLRSRRHPDTKAEPSDLPHTNAGPCVPRAPTCGPRTHPAPDPLPGRGLSGNDPGRSRSGAAAGHDGPEAAQRQDEAEPRQAPTLSASRPPAPGCAGAPWCGRRWRGRGRG